MSRSKGYPIYLKIATATFYSLISISLVLFNKNIFAVYGFDSPSFLCVCQAVLGIILTRLLDYWKIIVLQGISKAQVIKLIPLAVVYLSNILFGLLALKSINIPIYNTLRRSGILLVIAIEYYMYHSMPSIPILLSVLIIVFGTIFAGANDLSFDFYSYTICMIANVLTAFYVVLVKHFGKILNLEPLSLLYYNNLLSLPMAMLLSLVMQDNITQYSISFGFITSFLCSVLFSFLLNVGIYFNTSVNSPLSQSVIGQLKGYIQLGFGLILFNDYKYEFWNMIGMMVAMFGGLMYAYFSYVERSRDIKIK
eukprot:NODE_182_length_15748_cov_0.173174.p6 type:complete len:309 gc:universal NODE_182_length_15748_cov_0.173174:13636-14562(+)